MATIKSIEEKAKAYDDIIERLKDFQFEYRFSPFSDVIGDKFPELKESEDERIRKGLIEACKQSLIVGGFHKDKVIAWLEKQGGHANFINKIQIGDKVTRNEDGVLVNLSQLKRVAKRDEKQGEQKPADETKFKVGDWVVYCNEDVDLITGIEENGYSINNSGYIPFVCASDVRLWTIQDAKDGDVLSWDDSKCIALFKNIYDKESFNSYGFLGHCTGTFELRMSYHDIEGVHPATKEQRDTLMKAMADAGYTFDFEKKELKKIEQKPAESINDVYPETLDKAIDLYYYSYGNGNGYFENLSFEKFKDIAKTFVSDYSKQNPAWSEEDEQYIIDTINLLSFGCSSHSVGEVKDFLNSLKYRYTWKPSDGQMNALNYVVNLMASSERPTENDLYYNILKSLRQQLMKLKDEK